MTTNSAQAERQSKDDTWMDCVRDHVRSLRFGVVQIVVHDSRVVQIEKTEKIRLNPPVPE
jgi:hypothetical protein